MATDMGVAMGDRDGNAAERDALAAQLAEVRADLDAAPKVCAIHSYEHGPGPCMTCGAWPPGTRELIAACQTRIAGLEQAAGERAKEVARLTAELAAERQERAAGVTAAITDVREIERLNREIDELRSERAAYFGAAVGVAQALGLSSPGPAGEDPRFYAEALAFARSLEGHAKKLTARMAELETRPVLTEERLRGALFACADGASDAEVRAILAALGPVMLPAQDRAEELVSAWRGICTDSATCDLDPAERMRRALASLGAPPTSPTQDDPMRHHESRDYALQSPANGYWPADVGAVNGTEAMVMGAMLRSVGPHPISDAALIAMARTAIECVDKLGAPPTSPPVTIDADALYARCERDFMGGYSGPLYDAFKHGMWTVCNVLRSTPPTSPPAARPVFAGVSVEELARVFWCATGRGYKPEQWETLAPSTQAEWIKGIRAVLDRLEVSLVAPVDPEEVARDFYIRLSKLTGSLQLSAHTDGDRRDRIETMRATLIARGIPVTPERGQ